MKRKLFWVLGFALCLFYSISFADDFKDFLDVEPYWSPMDYTWEGFLEDPLNDLVYLKLLPGGPNGDSLLRGWVIVAEEDFGMDLYGLTKYNNLIITSHRGDWGDVTMVGKIGIPLILDWVTSDGEFGTETFTDSITHPKFWTCFYESFEDESADNWAGDGSGTWSIEYISDPGEYFENTVLETMGSSTAHTGWRGSYYRRNYDSETGFTYSVDVREYGISETVQTIVFFADQIPHQNGYEFSIKKLGSEGGEYSLGKIEYGAKTALIDWTPSPEIYDFYYEWNNLKIVTKGTYSSLDIALYINDEFIAKVTDTSNPYTIGGVGVGCDDPTGFHTVQFDDVTLHRLTDKLEPLAADELQSDKYSGHLRGLFK